MTREDPQFKLRVPAELREEIEVAAKANNRSMNAEIVARLQQTFEHPAALDPSEVLRQLFVEHERHVKQELLNVSDQINKNMQEALLAIKDLPPELAKKLSES